MTLFLEKNDSAACLLKTKRLMKNCHIGPQLFFIRHFVFRRQPAEFFFAIKSVKWKQVKITNVILQRHQVLCRFGFQHIHMISVSGHYIVKICQTVAEEVPLVYFTICLKSNFWRVFAIWPNCAPSHRVSMAQLNQPDCCANSACGYRCLANSHACTHSPTRTLHIYTQVLLYKKHSKVKNIYFLSVIQFCDCTYHFSLAYQRHSVAGFLFYVLRS